MSQALTCQGQEISADKIVMSFLATYRSYTFALFATCTHRRINMHLTN